MSDPAKLIYFEGDFYTRRDLDILLASRKIEKRISGRKEAARQDRDAAFRYRRDKKRLRA